MPMPVTVGGACLADADGDGVCDTTSGWLHEIKAPAITIRLQPTRTAAAQCSMKLQNAEATAPRMRMRLAYAMMWIPV